MPSLEEIIRAEIARSGPMRFDRFMEMALYYPGLGYYARSGGPAVIGKRGDFYTSVSVGPLFGRLLARQFHQMWQRLDEPAVFWIIEQGAHDGQLACDILDGCREQLPDFFNAMHYGIVQASGALSIKQKCGPDADLLSRITWFEDLAALAEAKPVGVFFSNELVDAFPIRSIAYRSGQWLEQHVADDGTALHWNEQPITDKELAQAIAALQIPAIEGYTTEINLLARKWMRDVAHALHRGYVVTIDYGYPAASYYATHRPCGTLTAFVRHHGIDDVLSEPGMRDITAHVDFTALHHVGEAAGLTLLGFVDQQHYLMGIAHDELAGTEEIPPAGIAKNTRAWQTLTHPDHLGATFFALIQAKDASDDLDSLRYARKSDL